jgi:hypothetical protein
MFYGGALKENDLFKHIVSIGYEMETHDISKLSLQKDDVLINSDTTNNDKKNMKKIDDHYYELSDKITFEENQKLLEYVDEPISELGKINDKDNVVFNITNELSNKYFTDKLYPICKEQANSETFNKNNLYTFEYEDNNKIKKYKIHFTESMRNKNDCELISGVEYICTFYHPKKSKNIILETFIYTCKLIINHLSDLKERRGNFMINIKNQKIPFLKKRSLFEKENTNIFYLQTNDEKNENNKIPFQIDKISILPQMTICMEINYSIPIMKEIMYQYSQNSKIKKEMMFDYKQIQKVDSCVKELFQKYQLNKSNVDMFSFNQYFKPIKMIYHYLFFIFYKIDCYVNSYLKYFPKYQDTYFKDYLPFASRHSNIAYWNEIIKIIQGKKPSLKLTEIENLLISLINQPQILRKYIYKNNIAIKNIVPSHVKEFGDPNVSILSYFQYLNINKKDWFLIDLDGNTAFFPIKEGYIMVEDRGFFQQIQEFYKTEVEGINLRKFPLINLYMKCGNELIQKKKVNDLSNYFWNNTTQRYNKKKTIKPSRKKQKTLKNKKG